VVVQIPLAPLFPVHFNLNGGRIGQIIKPVVGQAVPQRQFARARVRHNVLPQFEAILDGRPDAPLVERTALFGDGEPEGVIVLHPFSALIE